MTINPFRPIMTMSMGDRIVKEIIYRVVLAAKKIVVDQSGIDLFTREVDV